jgi:hypothetical protein
VENTDVSEEHVAYVFRVKVCSLRNVWGFLFKMRRRRSLTSTGQGDGKRRKVNTVEKGKYESMLFQGIVLIFFKQVVVTF